MAYSGLKRDSARSYLDSICKGDHPRLWKIEESTAGSTIPKKRLHRCKKRNKAPARRHVGGRQR